MFSPPCRSPLATALLIGLLLPAVAVAVPALGGPAPVRALAAPSDNLTETAAVFASSEEGADGQPATATVDGYYRTSWRTTPDDRNRTLTIRLAGAPATSAKRTVRDYLIRSSTRSADHIPASWVLEGSDDGIGWTTIDRRSGALTTPKQTARFAVAAPRPFHNYRFRFAASPAGPIEIADIALCEQTCDTSTGRVAEAMSWPITTHAQFTTTSDDGASGVLADGLSGDVWTARPGATTAATATIAAPFGHALPLAHYAIVAGSQRDQFPTDWTIEGSNDGVSWTVVDSRSGKWFSRPGEMMTFNARFIDRGYRLYRLNAAKTSQFAEIALCPWSCGRVWTRSTSALVNPVRSGFDVTVDGAPTTVGALVSDTAPGTWELAPGSTSTVGYRSQNQQAQAIGSYSIQARSGVPLSWTVWAKRSSGDQWHLLDTRTGYLGDGELTTFGLIARFPATELKVEFTAGTAPATIERFSLCNGPGCQTELTGPPGDPSTTVWQTQASNSLGGATLVGNGPLGARVYGGVERERIGINEHQIWQGAPLERGRVVSQPIRDEFERAVYNDDRTAVDRIVKQHLLDPLPPASYQTGGDLIIDTHAGPTASQYRRSLDAATGVATVSYIGADGARHTRRTFASFADPVIVSKLAVEGGTQHLTLRYETPMLDTTVSARRRSTVSAELIVDGITDDLGPNPGAVRYRERIIVRANNGTITVVGDTIEVDATSDVDIIIAADTNVTDYRTLRSDPEALTRRALSNNGVVQRGFSSLLQRHLAAYQPIFDRVRFEFPASAADRIPTDRRASARPDDLGYYALEAQYARYLLLASSRDSEPATLQGRWNDQRWPKWWSDYHLDINMQMAYSIAQNLNVAEAAGPLFDFIDDLAAEGARIAADQYGITNGGWVAHLTADLWRQSPVVRGTHTQWVQGGNWIAQAVWDHYLYSGDDGFLATRAYPVLRGNALFFDEILTPNPDAGDDHLVHFWSTSPEHQPLRADGSKASQVQMMPTMDAQLIRETYEHVIEASETLGIDPQLRKRWRATLLALPPPDPVSQTGQVREYYRDLDRTGDSHRHASHLYGAAEGTTLDLDDPATAQAVRTTLKSRSAGESWAHAWRAMIAARLGDPEMTLTALGLIARSAYPNLLSKVSGYPQIDATIGTADAFTEMLVQSHRSGIDLLPALPAHWTQGRVAGLRARGGFTITDLAWDGGTLSGVTIRSEAGQPLVVRSGQHRFELATEPGQVIELDAELNPR